MHEHYYESIQEMFRVGMSRTIPELEGAPLGLLSINLGAGTKKIVPADPIPLDQPEWDAIDPIPFGDGSVGTIHAYHFLEHLSGEEVVCVLGECQRVLAPGGVMNIVVPYYNSQLQAQSLDHRHAFCEETWRSTFEEDTFNIPGAPKEGWKFRIGLNVIIGIAERNLCLMTQLIRV